MGSKTSSETDCGCRWNERLEDKTEGSTCLTHCNWGFLSFYVPFLCSVPVFRSCVPFVPFPSFRYVPFIRLSVALCSVSGLSILLSLREYLQIFLGIYRYPTRYRYVRTSPYPNSRPINETEGCSRYYIPLSFLICPH